MSRKKHNNFDMVRDVFDSGGSPWLSKLFLSQSVKAAGVPC